MANNINIKKIKNEKNERMGYLDEQYLHAIIIDFHKRLR